MDGTVRLSGDYIPLNAQTKLSNKPKIHHSGVFNKNSYSIWWLHILRPLKDIRLFDDDVKICFWHPKINLKLVTAFLFILQEFLCIPISQVFGSSISSLNWEPFVISWCLLMIFIYVKKTLGQNINCYLTKYNLAHVCYQQISFCQLGLQRVQPCKKKQPLNRLIICLMTTTFLLVTN